ncbi:MAG TPA: hypothetical protein ENJ27_02160 [Candidatus Moranbacteria bacterium]|nr:hypothetical protein [Candidatus Moranbacteria bacterium]
MKFLKILFLLTFILSQEITITGTSYAFLGSGGGSMPVSDGAGGITNNPFTIGLGFDMTGILGEVEDRYHINKDSTRSVMERMNVAEQKGQAPEVDIFFNPSSPKFGEKITASAMPMYFKSDKSGMYYTWYLKHAKGKNKDLNHDGEIDIEDYKIEAMRIIANGGFKYEKVNYSTATDTDNDGYGPLKNFIQSGLDSCKDENGDKNCTRVPFGYKDSKKPSDGYRCYVQDFNNGTTYEIVGSDNAEESSSDDTSGTVSTDSSSSTSFSCSSATASRDICSLPEESPLVVSSGFSGEPIINLDQSITNGLWGTVWVFYEDNGQWYGRATEHIPADRNWVLKRSVYACENDPLLPNSWDACSNGCGFPPVGTKIYLAVVDDQAGTSSYTKRSAFTSFTYDYNGRCEASEGKPSICTHLFPHAPGYTTGDKDFPIGEEEFWRTNPEDPSTANNQNTDEANVAGLGIDTFTWTYLPGDQVGVAVEGQSLFETKHNDSSSGTMWALANNVFDGKGDCDIKNKGVYSETIKGYETTIPAAEIDINKCLKYNLVDPMKGGQPGNMETELTYYPTNPNKGDVLSMTANVSNKDGDNSQLYYRWSVYGGNDQSLDMEDWTELSNNADFREANGIKLLEGLGLDTFEMNLNTFNDKYIRIFVEAEEYYSFGESQDTTKSGKSDAIIQIGSMSNNSISLQTIGSDENQNICDEDGNNCQVLKNQIIEATLSDDGLRNFSWTLNGEPINYLQGDETAQGNIIRFPILGNPGDNYILKVIANDTASAGEGGNTGSRVILTKNIKIVKPSIKLGPINNLNSDSCNSSNRLTPIRLGTYNDLNGDNTADCSQSVFTATTGNITVPVNYYPANIENSLTDIQWRVNGVKQDNGNIDLSHYPVGSTVSVSLKARYVPKNRSELAQDWGVSQFDTNGKVLSDSIQIKITGNAQQSSKKSSKIIAGLIYNLPIQLLFLLKIVLTAIIIIFASGIVLSFNSKKV